MFALGSDLRTVEALLARAGAPVARAIARVMEGEEPSFADGLALAGADGADLAAMTAAADYLRRRTVGDTVTYVVNRNIQFTNVCNVGCKFCAFSVGPKSRDGYSLSMAEVVRKVTEARENGATEVCIQGGVDPSDDPYVYRDLIRAIKREHPDIHIHAFSPLEILVGAERTGLSIRDYLRMLRDEGLGTIPGTAAEILDDEIRGQISPIKLPTAKWVEVVTTAHTLGIRSSSTMMYGHVEQPQHWVRHVMLLRSIQRQTGGFTEFVPLGFVHQNTALYDQGNCRPGPTVAEDLRVHAFARLMFHGLIDHVQVSWVKMGAKLALMCLEAGADDFGGTLMEESISRLAGATAGEVLWPEEIQRVVRSIGRVPAERNTIYTRVEPAPEAPVGVRHRRVTRRGRVYEYEEIPVHTV